MNIIKKVIDLGDGRTIEIETGKLAKQADGSVVIKMGDTMLLATVVSSKEAKEGIDFYEQQKNPERKGTIGDVDTKAKKFAA